MMLWNFCNSLGSYRPKFNIIFFPSNFKGLRRSTLYSENFDKCRFSESETFIFMWSAPHRIVFVGTLLSTSILLWELTMN